MKTYPLTFQDNKQVISDLSKDFIRNALRLEEPDRMGWDEIYEHPLVESYFKNSLENSENKDHVIKSLESTVLNM